MFIKTLSKSEIITTILNLKSEDWKLSAYQNIHQKKSVRIDLKKGCNVIRLAVLDKTITENSLVWTVNYLMEKHA